MRAGGVPASQNHRHRGASRLGKKLEGAGKTARMLKVRTATNIEAASIKRWLKAASA